MNTYYHAVASAEKYGGQPDDYLPLHRWLDESPAFFADFRHRALRHHTEGIALAERIFGPTITNSEGRRILTRCLGEDHIKADLGRIPTAQDWLECLAPQPWMMEPGKAKYHAGDEAAEPCECQLPGYFYSGVPGIIARMEQGRLAVGATVERCDLC